MYPFYQCVYIVNLDLVTNPHIQSSRHQKSKYENNIIELSELNRDLLNKIKTMDVILKQKEKYIDILLKKKDVNYFIIENNTL